MQPYTWRWLAAAVLGLAGAAVLGKPARPPASRLAGYREAALGIATSSIRGLELAGQVAEQQARAADHWKQLFGSGRATFLETEHLLLYGKVPDRSMELVGASLEKQLALARAALSLEEEEPWPGKLTVYLFTERSKFTSFIRRVEKRRPESDDLGSFAIRGNFPHVAAGPARDKDDPEVEAQASAQLAAALLAKRAAAPLPDWVVAGFGRATYYRGRPPREQLAERKRAAPLLLSSKATAMSVWDGTVEREEAAVLRASLMDYLAYGPGKTRFSAFLEGFQPDEGAAQKTTADALKAANIDPQVLNKKWKTWARRAR